MVLVRLDNIEVCTFTFRESVLTVKLKLTGDNRVFTPTVEVKSSFGKNECSGIRYSGCTSSFESREGRGTFFVSFTSTRLFEKTRGSDEGVRSRCGFNTTEGLVGVRKGINGICVVERLSTKCLEKCFSGNKG